MAEKQKAQAEKIKTLVATVYVENKDPERDLLRGPEIVGIGPAPENSRYTFVVGDTETDEVPEWALEQIKNPSAWVEVEK